jgi:hypothetical protein
MENFLLSTSTAPFATGSGGQSAGKSIFYKNGLIYLGLQKTGNAQGDEFNIIDVRDPKNPVWLGGYSVGRIVNQIAVLNNYAYLATDDPNRELLILNVQDPGNIAMTGSYDAPGNTASGFGEAVFVASSTAALGRSYIYNQPEFMLLDLSSTSPSVLGSALINKLSETASVETVIIRDFIGFVLTNSELQLWDISNPQHMNSYTSSIPLPENSKSTSSSVLTCGNNTLYIASSDSVHTGYLTVVTGS